MAAEYKVGMKFRVNGMCSDNDVKIVSIENGIITLREINDAHNSPHNYHYGERDETGYLIERLTTEEMDKRTSASERYRYIPTNR